VAAHREVAGILPPEGRELGVAGVAHRTVRRLAVVLTCCACFAFAGCGGSSEGGGADGGADGGSVGGSGGSSDVCDALARFENSFEAAVDAVASGDTNAKMGAASTLRQEAAAVMDAMQSQKAALEPLADAVRDLGKTVTRLPPDATAQQAKTALKPRIEAVGDALDETASGVGCPAG
jgi:hypothetical protein